MADSRLTPAVRYRVTINLEHQATFGDGPPVGDTRTTSEILSGETLAGALAAWWLRDLDPSTDPGREFEEIFRRARFGPAVPAGATQEPLSVTRCKYQPRRDCRQRSVVDEAWTDPHPAPLDHSHAGEGEHRSEERPGCPVCGRTLERSKGRVELREGLTVSTHARLTAQETAQDGSLFRRESLRPTTLCGAAWLPAKLPAQLASGARIRVGAARSTRGTASVMFAPEGAADLAPATLERLKEQRQIVVRLLSPAVLVDRLGRPALAADAWAVELDRHFPGCGARVTRAWVRWEQRGGWSASSNLPKPTERVISAGSVLEVTFDCAPAPAAVMAFRDSGIGLRTHQGYGWLEVDPWLADTAQAGPDLVATAAEPATGALQLLKGVASHGAIAGRLLGVVREITRDGSLEAGDIVGALAYRDWYRRAPLDIRTLIATCLPQLSFDELRQLERHLDDTRRAQRAGAQ